RSGHRSGSGTATSHPAPRLRARTEPPPPSRSGCPRTANPVNSNRPDPSPLHRHDASIMPVQFAVLASGSRGNATLVKAGGAGLLADSGIGPRTIERRLVSVGASWSDVRAVVLTHTHGDHIDAASLGRIAAQGIPLYCHEGHLRDLRRLEPLPLLE